MSEQDTTAADDGLNESGYNDDSENAEVTEEQWTPPSREDYEALIADRDKNKRESIKRKKMLRDNGIDLATGKRADTDTSDSAQDDGDKVSKADFDKAVSQAKSRERRLAVELPAALEEAGWNGRNMHRIHKLLDLDAVEVDEDGVSGLVEQIEELKGDFPEFFKRTRKDVSPGGAVGVGIKETPSSSKEKDWKDVFRDQLKSQGIV